MSWICVREQSFSKTLVPICRRYPIATALESDNQLPLKVFTKWSNWADFTIRLDKRDVFGIGKNKTDSYQYLRKAIINAQRIPAVPLEESFDYLGKSFNYKMNTGPVEVSLCDELKSYLQISEKLNLHPASKIKTINEYIYSKLRWRLTIYNFSETWVVQNLDNLELYFVRKWLNLQPNANISHLRLRPSHLGIGLLLVSDIFRSCKVTLRRILRLSKNEDIRRLYKLTSTKNIRSDEVAESAVLISDMARSVKKCCDKIFESNRQKSILQKLLDLKKQSSIIQHISAHCTKSAICQWYTMVSRIPQSIYQFSRKGLILCLPTKVNMGLWSKSDNDHCSLCDQKQSQLHVLSYCQVALREKRYTWRHNSILLTVARFLSVPANSRGMKLFVDLDGHPYPGECFGSQRPDTVIFNGKEVIVIELSVCYETRTEEARNFKKRRYQNLKSDLSIEW